MFEHAQDLRDRESIRPRFRLTIGASTLTHALRCGAWHCLFRLRSASAIGAMVCFVLTPGGCATHGHPAAKHAATQKPACYPCGPCAGYFPTCWKRWPAECPGCPVWGGDEVIVGAPAIERLGPEGVPTPPKVDEMMPSTGGDGLGPLPLSPADEGESVPTPPLPSGSSSNDGQRGRYIPRGAKGRDSSSPRRDARKPSAPSGPSMPIADSPAARQFVSRPASQSGAKRRPNAPDPQPTFSRPDEFGPASTAKPAKIKPAKR
jgi:hypothetical protein